MEHSRPGAFVARSLLRQAASRIAREFAACDDVFASRPTTDGARWTFEHVSASVEVAGLDGPASRSDPLGANHPGLTDAVGVIASLDRADLRIVAADYPFLDAMRGVGTRPIFFGSSGASQLAWIRAVSRDPRRGGVVLLFPAGRLESDPAGSGRGGSLLPLSESVGTIH